MKNILHCGLLAVLSVGIASGVHGQATVHEGALIKARLSLFTRAQAEGDWATASSMLGGDRRGHRGSRPYTARHKECLVQEMQSLPLVSFDFKNFVVRDDQWGRPFAELEWLDIEGDATFKTMSGEQTERSRIVAYKNHGEWYFSPPDDWYWRHIVATDPFFSIDHGEEVQTTVNALAPLQVSEIHLFNLPNHPSERDVAFKVTNISAKKVTWFHLTLSLNGSSSEYG